MDYSERLEELEKKLDEALVVFKDHDDRFVESAQARAVLFGIFGVEWCERHIFSGTVERIINRKDDDGRSLWAEIVICNFADRCYELREVNGFDDWVERAKTRNDLEAMHTEIWVASALLDEGYSVEFIKETGEKGEDYDIEVIVNGVPICVESKAIVSHDDFSAQRLLNKLKKARKQLPSNRKGVISISLPETWMSNPELTLSVDSFLKGTKRVARVILHSTYSQRLGEGAMAGYLIKHVKNDTISDAIDEPVEKDFSEVTRGVGQERSLSFWRERT
ncbi:hypothetical protein E4634_00540 [Mangrovimicrobium sediminis]|uniref:Uncharacterized protein n=1 Tax=Mangrovimicrobium sediminis TaxID=2562682 RepID=A0A4Z0M8N1_9GAMM|nr:hypothetical protein [Haliea sp. SAOS-164]TGD76072.1 hypothetical protein E4634_00540 [Haliea sp. SAOS-164]